jgi:succinate-semialdehyde dehydrogenase/glutarate-semialdehyde dehydrogenase
MAVAVRTLQNFIGGAWVDATGDDARAILSPVTGEQLADAPNASPADVARAARAAREAQPRWAALSVFERAEVMHRIADVVEERREELARSLVLENGKPYKAEALDDVDEIADNFRASAEDAKRLESSVLPTQDAGKRMFTVRRPNGVYAAITPWNFPSMIPAELIAPGIAVGNAFVVKPSEWTPIAMADLMQAMADAGLPDGVVNLVYGAGDVGEALVTHDDVDAIAFVGSHGTAERIVRAAGLKRTLIEASGNGPVVVCADADLELAAKGAVYGGFFCAGQVCAATERVLVDRRVHDAFREAVVREAERWTLGDPFDDATLVGPMQNEPTAQKMDAHVEDAVAQGAEVLVGGSREDGRPTRLYYRPTVLDNVGRDTLVGREETFGPIVPLIEVDGDDDALAAANDSHLGLQAAVYTSDLGRAFRFAEELRAGSVVVNDSTMYWETLQPFGGAAGTKTGWGRVGGRHALEDMTDLRTIIIDVTGGADPAAGGPPPA